MIQPGSLARDLPSAPDAEAALLGCCFIDSDHPDSTIAKAIAAGVTSSHFYAPSNGVIFHEIIRLQNEAPPATAWMLASHLKTIGKLEEVGGMTRILELTAAGPTTAHAKRHISDVLKAALLRQIIHVALGTAERAALPHANSGELLDSLRELTEYYDKAGSAQIVAQLEACRVMTLTPPPEPITRIFLAGKPIATPGNLSCLIAKAKTGKTASIGGIVASAVAAAAVRTGLDTLGFTASNPEGKALLLIDTEQSTFDAYACLVRAMRRAGQEDAPPWLYVYSFAGYSAAQLRAALPALLAEASRKHGGIFAVVLDGVADFVMDPNDPKECNPFVAELHGMAIRQDCPIICVIHSNEGAKAGDDGRGHLGKQLTRKAESNLLLKKDGDITTITSEKQRKAPITAADGVAFKWSDDEGRHVSCGTPLNTKVQAKTEELHELAAEVFGTDKGLRWAELNKRIGDARTLSGNTSGRRITEMRKLAVIRQTQFGLYEMVA
jgi:hypothetical protein